MAQIQALNPTTHKSIGINTDYSPGLGYDQGAAMIMPSEIRELQRDYAILFRKHPETGRLFPNALLGFTENENLYMAPEGGWRVGYVPMVFTKGPFLIGMKQDTEDATPFVSIDMDDPRVSTDNGNKLFDDDGKATRYLDQINDTLASMHQNQQVLNAMVDAFTDAKLIEPVSLDITLANGEHINFGGAYTVSEEKLSELDAETLNSLNEKGYLSAAFYIAGSIENIRKVIAFKNERL